MMRWGFVCIALVGCVDVDVRSAVNGKFVDRLYTPRGVVEQPADLSTRAFRVYSNGRWYPDSGLVDGADDGTIYIEVPDGPYLLNTVHLDGSMSWDQREDHTFVDVAVRTGRPDAQPATNVPMQMELTNLAPWAIGTNELRVDCYENGTEHYPFELQESLSAGATAVRGTFDWASTYSGPGASLNKYRTAYLLDANAGDVLTISRQSNVSIPNLGVSRLTQIARGPVNTQRDGEASSFTATFSDVAPAITQRFTVDMPAIVAQLPDVNGWVVGLRKSPSSVAFDTFGASLLAVSPNSVGTVPFSFTESYGDPFDADWQLVATGTYVVQQDDPVLPDGRPVYYPWSAYATEQRHIRPGEDFTLGPTSAFATSASLDGHVLVGDVPWDGRSPLSLHVDVPADEVGFIADVLWVPAGETFPELWTTLRSQAADVMLPADALQLGLDYFVRVAITNETETSHSAAYKLLGPFRLVRQ
jgi:hypothetical protein